MATTNCWNKWFSANRWSSVACYRVISPTLLNFKLSNLEERLEGILIKLVDYTKLGRVSKTWGDYDSQRYSEVKQWDNSNKIKFNREDMQSSTFRFKTQLHKYRMAYNYCWVPINKSTILTSGYVAVLMTFALLNHISNKIRAEKRIGNHTIGDTDIAGRKKKAVLS